MSTKSKKITDLFAAPANKQILICFIAQAAALIVVCGLLIAAAAAYDGRGFTNFMLLPALGTLLITAVGVLAARKASQPDSGTPKNLWWNRSLFLEACCALVATLFAVILAVALSTHEQVETGAIFFATCVAILSAFIAANSMNLALAVDLSKPAPDHVFWKEQADAIIWLIATGFIGVVVGRGPGGIEILILLLWLGVAGFSLSKSFETVERARAARRALRRASRRASRRLRP